VAAQFVLGDATTISSVEGWIGSSIAHPMTISIYSGNSLPGSALYSDTFTSSISGWQGVSGEHWSLDAGTYWVVFSNSSTVGGNWMPAGAAHPLPNYAIWTSWGGAWANTPYATVGVRIDADVPEPASWSLMLAGFMFVGGALRGRSRQVPSLT
jgi:hypothetical protein